MRYRAAILLVLSTLPFIIGLTNEFAGDDPFLIVTRLDPARVGSPTIFFSQDYWDSLDSGLYRPVGLAVLFAERLAFGTARWPYRVVSLVLHAGVVFVLWGVFSDIAGRSVAWLAAAVFACHPIHAEAILFAYGQLDLLAALFLLASFWFFAQERLWIGFACALTAMFCKESALVAPLLAWWVFRRRRTRVFTHPAVLSLAAAVVYASAKLLAIGTLVVPAQGSVSGGAIGSVIWLKTIVVSAAHAIRLTVLPTGQTIYYGHLRDSIGGQPWHELLWLIAGIVTLGWCLRSARRPRRLLTAIGIFVLCWLPISNVLPVGVVVAERGLYLPSAGIALAAGLAWRHLHWSAVTVVLLVASLASTATAWNWRTEESLWTSTVLNHPRSPRGHAALGLALLQRFEREPSSDLLQQASRSFDTALSLNNRAAEALYGKGLVLLQLDRPAEACPLLNAAAQQRPGDAVVETAWRECELLLRLGKQR